MHFQNTQLGFLYRQFFLTPSALPNNLSLANQTGIVTGANTGLGFAACQQLLAAGLSHLILAVRNPEKGEAARDSLFSSLPSSLSAKKPTIEVWILDLEDYESITAFTRRLRESDLKINFAILNAGMMTFQFRLSEKTGHEMTTQVNWLGNALLTIQLRKLLQEKYIAAGVEGKPPVISIVNSEVASWAKFNEWKIAERNRTNILQAFDDERNYDELENYYSSKLLQQLFFVEFVNRIPEDNRVILNLVNPGFCWGTDLHREAGGVFAKVANIVKRIVGRTTTLGARTLVHGGVVAGVESHGKFLSDGRIAVFGEQMYKSEARAMRENSWRELAKDLETMVDIDGATKA